MPLLQGFPSLARSRRSGRRASNPRPLAWEANALPTELRPLEGAILALGAGLLRISLRAAGVNERVGKQVGKQRHEDHRPTPLGCAQEALGGHPVEGGGHVVGSKLNPASRRRGRAGRLWDGRCRARPAGLAFADRDPRDEAARGRWDRRASWPGSRLVSLDANLHLALLIGPTEGDGVCDEDLEVGWRHHAESVLEEYVGQPATRPGRTGGSTSARRCLATVPRRLCGWGSLGELTDFRGCCRCVNVPSRQGCGSRPIASGCLMGSASTPATSSCSTPYARPREP